MYNVANVTAAHGALLERSSALAAASLVATRNDHSSDVLVLADDALSLLLQLLLLALKLLDLYRKTLVLLTGG